MNDNTPPAYLTPEELSVRFRGKISVRTLANWRSSGADGPRYRKIGGRVLYLLSDVEAWEHARTATSTSGYKAAG